MAVIPDSDRLRVWRGLMRVITFGGIPNVNKADLKAAVDAVDVWVDGNASSYNVALPQPFRNNASPAQKAFILMAVVAARMGITWLIALLGTEVD